MDKSFDILAEQFRPMLLSFLTTLSGDSHVAEDLVQETLIAAQESLDRFDKKGNFGAWLRGIARNKLLEHRRVVARRKLVVDSQVVDGVEDVYSMFDEPRTDLWSDRLSVMNDCIAELQKGTRQVVESIYQKGETTPATALAMGLSAAAVGQRLSRARKQIRQCVQRRLKGATHA